MENFQMYKMDLDVAEEQRLQIANICWVIEKAREFQKKKTKHLLH